MLNRLCIASSFFIVFLEQVRKETGEESALVAESDNTFCKPFHWFVIFSLVATREVSIGEILF